MTLRNDPKRLISQPACIAIRLAPEDRARFHTSNPSSPLDALAHAGAFKITKECVEPPLSLTSPEQYTNALVSEIRTSATVGKPLIYAPSDVLARATAEARQSFRPKSTDLEPSLADLCSIIRTRQELSDSVSQSRSWILDLSGGCDRLSPSWRHLGGSPISRIEAPTMLVDVAGKILQAYQLRSLGSSFESTSRSPLQFVQSRTIHTNGSCVIDSAVLTGVAAAFNSASIQVEADLTLPKRGFFASYNAEDFARMLRKPGCRMNLMRLGNTVLGYSVSYLDPEHLPRHGQRLVAALDSHGLIEDGATIGFVDLIHVTDIGRQICQIARINPTELLHKKIAEDAQAAGINILVAQTREFPHPNHEALKSHKMHGCRDPGVFLLYPTSEGENGWQYSLGRVLVLDLRPKQQS